MVAVLAASAVAAVLAHWLAAAINLPRPFVLGLSPAYIPHGARGSLPSAHASVMFTIALAFLLRPGLRGLGVAAAALAVATGWARIYVGIHFPIDIAAGLLLAAAVAGVFAAIYRLCRHYVAPIGARNDSPVRTLTSKADKPAC
ncbi:phosphatase PAP2 family protein [Variovorax paradoxus]|nr:phosphatase PAP2 family protein [Variovorax paradoxus]